MKISTLFKKGRILCLLLFTLFLVTSFTNKPTKWRKAYNKKGILIYTRSTPKGFKEFKAITTINKPMNSVLAVMKDYEAHPDWMLAIKECKRVKQVNPKTRYLYYMIRLPWPLANRDLVSKSTFKLQKDGSVLMTMSAAPKKKPKIKNRVRIKEAKGYWKVIPINKNQTKVVYQYASDPVGLPPWLVNMFLLDAPLNSFEGLKKQVKLPKYKNPDMTWLYGTKKER